MRKRIVVIALLAGLVLGGGIVGLRLATAEEGDASLASGATSSTATNVPAASGAVPSVPVAAAPPQNGSAAGSSAGGAQPALAASARTTGANPAKSSPPSVWTRLNNSILLASDEQKRDDGSVQRSRLLRVEGKYPLVVFNGTVPQADPNASDDALIRSSAKVADHVVVSPRAGVSSEEFRRSLAAKGLTLDRRLSPDGPYLAKLPTATTSAVDHAIGALQGDSSIAYVEPDYLVHASDIPAATRAVDLVNGHMIFPEAALDASTVRPADGPTFSAEQQAADVSERLTNLPAGARVLVFDPPYFLGGPAMYNPYLEEQNFVVSTDVGVYVQNAYTSGYPNNGTYYARTASSESNLTVKHREGLPFTILTVDLAEYSTVFTAPKTITFTGYKPGGGTVTQSFTTDGIIDGLGPAGDFQTFTFNTAFTGLTRVTASTTGFMIDNIAVQVEGQETPPAAPPAPPLIYDVTWDAPKHTVNQPTGVAGAYAPSSINFGAPTVRSQIGTLAGPALEFRGTDYQQIRFGLRRNAQAYRLEFDSYIDLPTAFTILFDGAQGVQNLYFKPDGTISAFQRYTTPPSLGTYPVRQKTRIAVQIDMTKSAWEILVDGVSKYRGPFDATADLTDVRFHTSDAMSGSAGVDNVRIYAYGSDTAPVTRPRLYLSPSALDFPALPIGSRKSWPLALRNNGNQTLNITGVSSSSSQFAVRESFPLSIIPGGLFYLNVDFTPQTIGKISGQLEIASNDPERPLVAVPVTGTGMGVPRVALSPANLLVTMVANSAGTENFLISNLGQGDLRWNLVLKGGATNGGPPTDPSRTPNDTMFGSLWAMSAPGTGRGGIDSVHAWSVTTGSATDVIAVIDTGADRTHPELQGNLWTNPGEIPGNNIDDDANGYVDDVNGWDFANGDANPADGHGHGTHVAGTIAARGDNSNGIAGVCWNARIMPLKFLSDGGSGYTSDAVSAVRYATRMGARISNNSWGGGGYSQALADSIDQAGDAGSLFVAAAGNASADNDAAPSYPASYNLDNVVAVAATNSADELAHFSNFGRSTVALAAPGADILSLRPGGQYAYGSGTSMAAPHVVGAAALLLSQNPTLTPAQTKQLLAWGSDSLPTTGQRVASGGRLNAYRALKATVPKWLRPEVTTGHLTPGASQIVPLAVDTASLTPGTYTQTIALTSNDPTEPLVNLPVVLNVLQPTPYHQWIVGEFGSSQMLPNNSQSTLWGDAADPDGDGLGNLIEFITGSDPNRAQSVNAPAVVQENGDVTFEFYVRDPLNGASYTIEWTPDLATTAWASAGLTIVENTTADVPAGLRRIRVKTASKVPGAFFRIIGTKLQ